MNSTNIILLSGIVVLVVGYGVYRLLRKKKVVYTKLKTIDYDYILGWVKSQREKLDDGSSLNIAPYSVSINMLKESGVKDLPKSNLISLILLDKNKQLIDSSFIIYEKMSDSLNDLLPKDRIYTQMIKV